MHKKSMLFFIVFVVLSCTSFSLSVKIDLKEEFKTGDDIKFRYSMHSYRQVELNYSINVSCPLDKKDYSEHSISIQSNQTIDKEYQAFSIEPSFNKQTCKVAINANDKEWVNFFTLDVKPKLDFDLYFCTSKTCVEKKKCLRKIILLM